TPPLEHLAGRVSIALFQPARDSALERRICRLALFSEMWREHFLLQSEIQIERHKNLVPCSLSPAQLSIVKAQRRGGICFGASSAREIDKCSAVIISRRTLQRMADSGTQCQKPDRRRCARKRTAKRQMNVNARESQMIGNA